MPSQPSQNIPPGPPPDNGRSMPNRPGGWAEAMLGNARHTMSKASQVEACHLYRAIRILSEFSPIEDEREFAREVGQALQQDASHHILDRIRAVSDSLADHDD